MKYLLALLLSLPCYGVTANKIWRVPNGGTLPAWGPLNLAGGSVAVTGLLPRSNLAAVNYHCSSGNSGTFFTTSTSYVDVTNLSVSIAATTGDTIHLFLRPAAAGVGNGGSVWGGTRVSVSGSYESDYTITDTGNTAILETAIVNNVVTGTGLYTFPITSFGTDLIAGSTTTFTYKVRAKTGDTNQQAWLHYADFCAYIQN